MRFTFRLRFHTEFGQSLWLTGPHAIFGSGVPERAVPLQYLNAQFWQVTFITPRSALPNEDLVYRYLLRNPDGTVIEDWGNERFLNFAAFDTAEEVVCIDTWNPPGQYENAFYTEPFKEVLLKQNHTELRLAATLNATHAFRVKAPLLSQGQTVCLLGNVPELGNWDINRQVLLSRQADQDFFSAELDLGRAPFPISYKFGVYDIGENSFLRYEDGENRLLDEPAGLHKQVILNDGFMSLPATTWKGAGVAIPVFSLRSASSFGVGEFADLKLLVDWCCRAGLKLIQILPVNDTTATHSWLDSYPYSAVSAFALHPLYLNLDRLVTGKNRGLPDTLEKERRRLNSLPQLDYDAVMKAKLTFLKEVFRSQKERVFTSKDYRSFFDANKHWLVPYAAFCCFRDTYGTPDFTQWPAHRRYDAAEIAALSSVAADGVPAKAQHDMPSAMAEQEGMPTAETAADAISFQYFLQYQLHVQLLEATAYAHAKGVILKGDIAIGVCRSGADAWQSPELFNTDMQAGAPPDAFAEKGQNWSFPTYNWPRMKQDGFAWWKQRFAQMGNYFDAFRLDHVLGFFRIWSIPTDAVEGILGYFVPAIPVRVNEFSARGIPFERTRFSQPWITEGTLLEVFGNEAPLVKTAFLVANSQGGYRVEPQFATQRQVEQHFSSLQPTPKNVKLKHGLFDLISNVLLIETPSSDGQEFHFRFGIEKTQSFKELEPIVQERLMELYIDYFFRRQDEAWRKEAFQKLPALKRVTNMLVCGEDLGMVPACVPDVMKQLGLLSLEVQRMPKRLGQQFFNPKDASFLSVVTPSTHDMSTIRGWWREDRSVIQQFFNTQLGRPGEAPVECDPWVSKLIIEQHLSSPAMWSIFQLQDLLGMDPQLRRDDPDVERINVPANPKNYWCYRMHLSLEDLLLAESFNDELKELVKANAR
jgi:4-alpha-glucanotransferase